MNTCPPGFLCIDYSHIIIFTLIVILIGFYFTTNARNNNIIIETEELNNKIDNVETIVKDIKKNKIRQEQIDEQKQIDEQQQIDEQHNTVYTVPAHHPRNNQNILQEPRKVHEGVPINISTRGETPEVQQLGMLTKTSHSDSTSGVPGTDVESHILPLYGRKTYNRSSKWVYYTATDKFNQVRIPISNNGRNCDSEYGCDELMDGSTITIPELNGSFTVKLYENKKFYYIPY